MKRQKRLGTFLSGMLAGAMLLGCGTAAFAAAGGSVSFGTMGLKSISGKTVVEPGDTITNATGCEIPAAIVYTDEAGGDNTYIHIRTVGQAMDMPIDYEGNMIYMGGKPGGLDDITITEFPTFTDPTALNAVGSKAAYYTEVEPYWPTDEERSQIFRDKTHIISNGAGGSMSYTEEGEYLSLSITNNTEVNMYLTMRCPDPYYSNVERFPTTLVPAGQTVVRTFLVGEYTGYTYPRHIEYSVYYVQSASVDPMEKTDVTISAVSFEKK